jgi:hypothetical protein
MKLQLKKGRSYSGFGVVVTAAKPIIEIDEAVGKKLIASGYFKLIAATPEPEKEEDITNLFGEGEVTPEPEKEEDITNLFGDGEATPEPEKGANKKSKK